jgi:hypothetical protein
VNGKSITAMNLQPGATWTFVHSDGKRTEYVYDRLMAKGYADPSGKSPGHSPMHALLNPASGKCAQVTEKWLREPPVASGASSSGFHSHWVADEPATVEQAA